MHTPPLASGCINGVYRRFVMNEGFINLPHWGRTEIKEYSILANDLSKYQLFVANSVRGVLPAELL